MRYFEDFVVGETLDLGTVTVDEAEMLGFARRYDPQPFHTSDEGGRNSPFGAVIASGWFTCALWMRLYVDAVLARSSSQGSPGIEELRWLRPVLAGDVLLGRTVVLDATPSAKRADRGTLRLRGEMVRDGEPVMTLHSRAMFGRRPD